MNSLTFYIVNILTRNSGKNNILQSLYRSLLIKICTREGVKLKTVVDTLINSNLKYYTYWCCLKHLPSSSVSRLNSYWRIACSPDIYSPATKKDNLFSWVLPLNWDASFKAMLTACFCGRRSTRKCNWVAWVTHDNWYTSENNGILYVIHKWKEQNMICDTPVKKRVMICDTPVKITKYGMWYTSENNRLCYVIHQWKERNMICDTPVKITGYDMWYTSEKNEIWYVIHQWQ